MPWFFVFFLASGFCSLVYQVTWLRGAMASFGVTTPSVSIVLSVFMAGIGLGSWLGGSLVRRTGGGAPRLLGLYALTEAWIGVGGFAVAPAFVAARRVLAADSGAAWGSGSYYVAAGACVALVLLPFCTAMGATFPLAMAAVRALRPRSERTFSFLYAANLLGAMLGAFGSAFVAIELLGFRGTMHLAAALNGVIALLALAVGRWLAPAPAAASEAPAPLADGSRAAWQPAVLAVLAATGFSSLGMEVVWTRQFVPYQGPFVYTFATILGVYLGASYLGTVAYRAACRRSALFLDGAAWRGFGIAAAAAGLVPLLAADRRLDLPMEPLWGAVRVIAGITPFCALLGFLTPWLIDRVSGGDPRRAGIAYAINTIGCIVGPIVAGFGLLPWLGERGALLALALPLFALSLAPWPGQAAPRVSARLAWGAALAAALGATLASFTHDFSSTAPRDAVVRHDHTATVIAFGQGMRKRLIVNGQIMTSLTPSTKMMTHLPLSMLSHEPKKGLVLCLGMGTSFRSMHSWGIEATVVELVPSLPPLLPMFHADFSEILVSPNAHVVLDDARRFLERTDERFDVIVIDPPPPLSAAASSLLYSAEFYEVAARRLVPGGILQQWLPGGEPIEIAAMAKALATRFPYIRVFGAIEGRAFGLHFLASDQPIPLRTPAEALARFPEAARADLVEWSRGGDAEAELADVLERKRSFDQLIERYPDAPVLSDDRPVNEYYLMRTLFAADPRRAD
jgi:spermidine synthase